MKALRSALVTFVGLLLLGAAAVKGSDNTSIYAIVTKVAMEPDERVPERIKIWGAFKMRGFPGFEFKPAQRGYLYFKVQPAIQRATWEEWFDLKRVAGTGQGIGFGSFWTPIPGGPADTVRPTEIAVYKEGDSAVPEVYKTNIGVVKMSGSEYHATILAELTNALKAK